MAEFYDDAVEEVARFLPLEYWGSLPRMVSREMKRMQEQEDAAERMTSATGESSRDILRKTEGR